MKPPPFTSAAKVGMIQPPVQLMSQLQMSKLFDDGGVEAAPFEAIHAVMESTRLASRFITKGCAIGARSPDLVIRVNIVPESSQWEKKEIHKA